MINMIIAENFINSKKTEYVSFVECLGCCVHFSEDKWVCDKLRRTPAENPSDFTVYFSRVPEQHREMVKYFSAICFIQRKSLTSVRTYISDLIRFFGFWFAKYNTAGLHICNEFDAAMLRQYLEENEASESTKARTWSTVNLFFKAMNGWDDMFIKNPFSISPFRQPKKFDSKYIPENVALQLDSVFKREDVALHLRCAYWILRLIPSRISEIVGMSIDCLKRYNGNYVLFIPTWKQNGGRLEPIMRSIHLEEIGIAEYLINLIKKQQEVARQLQEHMPDNKKGALFTFHEIRERKSLIHHVNLYRVSTKATVRVSFQRICEKHKITDSHAQIYRITTHQFRHNGITDRLAAGFTTAQIAEMTGHHGSAMIFNAYAHLNLLPETIIQKQEYISHETNSRENRYILFGGRILNMDEQLEKRLLRNLRAHKVRGGICSDITGCKSDMWDCLNCTFFVPDADQVDYYKEQAMLWREKCVRFSGFPIIKGNAEKNADLYELVLKKIKGGEYPL